jgi:hypothetical protein
LSSYQRDEPTPVATEDRSFLDADNTESYGEPGVTSLVQDTLPAEVQGSGSGSSEDVENSLNNFAQTPM